MLFGKDAIDAWANSLLLDEEFKDLSMLERPLDTYGGCMVMAGTNMYNIQSFLDRAIKFCPDIKLKINKMKELFAKEQEILNEIVEFQGGYFFDKDRNALLDRNFRVELASKVHKLGEMYMLASGSL